MKSSRRPRRFFSEIPLGNAGDFLLLSPEESLHLRQTLRLNPGDRCLVADSQGRQSEAEIESFAPDGRARLKLGAVSVPAENAALRIHLCAAIPKGIKFEYLIQKAQEIGLDALTPVMTERTVVRLDPKKESPKSARWLKIAQEALKQSGSSKILEIRPPALLAQVLAEFHPGGGIAAVMHPSEDSMPVRLWLEKIDEVKTGLGEIRIFIGPEGGFSLREIQKIRLSAAQAGWVYHQVSLGRSVLKTDTAFMAVSALVKAWTQSLDQDQDPRALGV